MRLLFTRPVEDARRQAATFEAVGHEAIIRPLLEVVFPSLTPLRLDGVQGLIATSRNALRGLSRNMAFEKAKTIMVFCVGDSTATFADELGFTRVVAGDGAAKDLIPIITYSAAPESGPLLYLTGQHLAFDLETPLKAKGFAVPRVIIYEAREADGRTLTGFAEALRSGVDGAVLMSQRTAAICAKAIKQFKLQREAASLTWYCYSDAVAQPLQQFEDLTIKVAPAPTEADLIDLIGPAAFGGRALADLQEVLEKR